MSFSDSQIDSADAIIDPTALGGSVPPPVPNQPSDNPSASPAPPPIKRTTKPVGAQPSAPPIPAKPLPPPPPPPYTPPAVRPATVSSVSPQPLGNGRSGVPKVGGFVSGGVGSNLVGNADSAALVRARESGVGSARGIAWRDELPVGDEEEARDEDELDLQREAPAWLISLVVHLVLLLVLGPPNP